MGKKKIRFEIEVKDEDIKGRCLFHKHSLRHKIKTQYTRKRKHKG